MKTAAVDADGLTKPDAIEHGRRLFAQECRFTWAAASLDDLPAAVHPEVAFAGRSNVGKSSLINALTGRGALARTSNTPGRTQQLIFFDLGGRLTLVDMPGYGYAKAPKAAVAAWTELVRGFLRGRPALRRLCLLIDARHGLKDNDRDVMTMLDGAAVGYQIVLTKCDKPKPDELARLIEAISTEAARHVAAHPVVIATSANEGDGIELLRSHLAALAEPSGNVTTGERRP
jgi:GTP-binding protein